MHKFELLIKGDEGAAKRAATARGFTVVQADQRLNRFVETALEACHDDPTAAHHWLNEEQDPPFKYGALLFFK